MRLADLHPELKGTVQDGTLYFDCPICRSDDISHRVGVKIGTAQAPHTWKASGTYPDSLTLEPSIAVQGRIECWHGFIRNGEITNA